MKMYFDEYVKKHKCYNYTRFIRNSSQSSAEVYYIFSSLESKEGYAPAVGVTQSYKFIIGYIEHGQFKDYDGMSVFIYEDILWIKSIIDYIQSGKNLYIMSPEEEMEYRTYEGNINSDTMFEE